MKIKVILIVVVIFTIFSSCKNSVKPNVVYVSNFNNFNTADTNIRNQKQGSAYSGEYYIQADSTDVYPYGQLFILPDSLKNTDLKVFVTAYIRSSVKNPKASFAVTINGKDSSSFVWKEMFLTNQVAIEEQWNIFSDSVEISKEEAIYLPLKLNVFAFCPNKLKYIDFDDVTITVKSNFKAE